MDKTITFTYTSSNESYPSGTISFTGNNNCEQLKDYIVNNIISNQLLTGTILGNGYGSAFELFKECRNLTLLNLIQFNTNNINNMSYMFYRCENIAQLNLSSFNTSNVTDMSYMFYGCKSLSQLNLSSFNTSNVTTMRYMFYYCGDIPRNLELNLSNFNTSNVTSMLAMFERCKATIIGLKNFNTSNVTTMTDMFEYYSGNEILDLSSFNTSNVTSMAYMFYGCGSRVINCSSFNTSNVTTMISMFYSAKSEILNLNNFIVDVNINNVYMPYMFERAENLIKIFCKNTWSTNRSDEDMFYRNFQLVGAISYSSAKKTIQYANPNTGYFSYLKGDLNDEPFGSVNVNGTTVSHVYLNGTQIY